MKVIDLLKSYATEHDFDGLVSEDGECGCWHADYIPCDNTPVDCEFGRHYESGNCGGCVCVEEPNCELCEFWESAYGNVHRVKGEA